MEFMEYCGIQQYAYKKHATFINVNAVKKTTQKNRGENGQAKENIA